MQQTCPIILEAMTDTRQAGDDPRVTRTRAHALEVTLELAADSGLHACTFDAVSERSGIARSTLYRHWANQSELVMDALTCQQVERVSPDTGSLRDDMLGAMLGLGHALEDSTWGAMLPQLVAAASIDSDMRAIQNEHAEYHQSIDVEIIERAMARGEVAPDTDTAHAALLFHAPIFSRYLQGQPIDARWITSHVDKTVALLRPRSPG